jgi:hypothetical protein
LLWTVEAAGTLARYDCSCCRGTGIAEFDANEVLVPCVCVCRRVFQICYRRFRRCAAADGSARRVTFTESPRGVDRHLAWIRRNEDYCADFQAAGRRSLNAELYRVFRFYHLLGASAELVARRLDVSRAEVFRLVARVESVAGREIATLRPYSLYPPGEYLRPRLEIRAA